MKHDAASWDKLLLVLEWILDVKLRYHDHLHFSLIYLSMGDRNILGNEYGAPVAHKMLVELSRKFRLSMRKSDIVARNNTDYWLLLSHVQPELVLERISKIVEIASADGFDLVDRDISFFKFQDNNFLKQNGLYAPSVFLDYLKENRSVLKSWAAVQENAKEDISVPPSDIHQVMDRLASV